MGIYSRRIRPNLIRSEIWAAGSGDEWVPTCNIAGVCDGGVKQVGKFAASEKGNIVRRVDEPGKRDSVKTAYSSSHQAQMGGRVVALVACVWVGQ